MDLFTKAKDLGIQTEFVDGQGHRHVTDAVALKIILDALPIRVPYRFLDEAVVVRSGRPSRTELKAATFPLLPSSVPADFPSRATAAGSAPSCPKFTNRKHKPVSVDAR